MNDEDTTTNKVVSGDADAGTDSDNGTTTRHGTRSATGADVANAGVSGAVDSVEDLSATSSVPQSDDSASGLASVLSSSTGGVSITQHGVDTDGSATILLEQVEIMVAVEVLMLVVLLMVLVMIVLVMEVLVTLVTMMDLLLVPVLVLLVVPAVTLICLVVMQEGVAL